MMCHAKHKFCQQTMYFLSPTFAGNFLIFTRNIQTKEAHIHSVPFPSNTFAAVATLARMFSCWRPFSADLSVMFYITHGCTVSTEAHYLLFKLCFPYFCAQIQHAKNVMKKKRTPAKNWERSAISHRVASYALVRLNLQTRNSSACFSECCSK